MKTSASAKSTGAPCSGGPDEKGNAKTDADAAAGQHAEEDRDHQGERGENREQFERERDRLFRYLSLNKGFEDRKPSEDEGIADEKRKIFVNPCIFRRTKIGGIRASVGRLSRLQRTF